MKHFTIAFLLLAGCPATNEQIKETLENAGFSNIQDKGTAIFGCGNHEIGSEFTATNPQGRTVSGYVCCGGYTPFTKGCTIRY